MGNIKDSQGCEPTAATLGNIHPQLHVPQKTSMPHLQSLFPTLTSLLHLPWHSALQPPPPAWPEAQPTTAMGPVPQTQVMFSTLSQGDRKVSLLMVMGNWTATRPALHTTAAQKWSRRHRERQHHSPGPFTTPCSSQSTANEGTIRSTRLHPNENSVCQENLSVGSTTTKGNIEAYNSTTAQSD